MKTLKIKKTRKREEETFSSEIFHIFGDDWFLDIKLSNETSLDTEKYLNSTKLIKVNLEGKENLFIDELKKIENETEKIVWLKFNPQKIAEHKKDPLNLLKEVKNLGFEIFVLSDLERKIFNISRDLSRYETLIGKQETGNILCIRKKGQIFVSFYSHSHTKSGSEMSMIELLQGLIKRKVLCHVVLPGNGPLADEIAKLPVSYEFITMPWWGEFGNGRDVVRDMSKFLPRLIKKCLEIDPDIIYTNTSVLNLPSIVAKSLKKPHVWHIREYGEIANKFRFILRSDERKEFIKKYSDFIIYNSKAVEKVYGQVENSKVIYNNVVLNNEIRKYQNIYSFNDSLKLLIIGRIDDNKRTLDAAIAVKNLIYKGLNIELALAGVGVGEYFEQFKSYIKQNNLENNIHLLDFYPNTEAISQCDIGLLCSERESFGRVLVEYMLMSKAVIASKTGGIVEIVKHNENGILYETGNITELENAIANLYHNSERRIEMGNNGKVFAMDNFSDEKYSGEIYAILVSLKNKFNNPMPIDNLMLQMIYKLADETVEETTRLEKALKNKEMQVERYKKRIGKLISVKNEFDGFKKGKFWKVVTLARKIKR